MPMKINRSADVVITCSSFPKMTEDEKMRVIIETEQFLNKRGVFNLDIETLPTLKIGVRVHIK